MQGLLNELKEAKESDDMSAHDIKLIESTYINQILQHFDHLLYIITDYTEDDLQVRAQVRALIMNEEDPKNMRHL